MVYPELKNANALLVSHNHRDHLDARWTADYLKVNSNSTFITSSQVSDSVVNVFGLPQSRVVNLLPKMNEEMVTHSANGLDIRAWWIRHGGQQSYSLVNLCFLVEVAGKKIFAHGRFGVSRNFDKIDLTSEGIDLLLVPGWCLVRSEDVAVIQEKIKPKQIVSFHLLTGYEGRKAAILKNFPDVTFWYTPYEKITLK